MRQKLRAAVIGVGYLGKFHAEKYRQLSDLVDLVAVVDTNLTQAQDLAERLQVKAYQSYQDLDGQVDIVSIVVPTEYHFKVSEFFLKKNVHVLVEKPFVKTLEQAEKVIALAKEKNLILQVGHLERFNPIFSELENILSQPQFIESHRLSSFSSRGTDVNVILDLMIHDIDLIQAMVKSPIARIDANGACILSDKIDIANARIHFENGCVANVTASRVSFKAERKMRIFQHDAYIVADYRDRTLDIYRKSSLKPGDTLPEIAKEQKQYNAADALLEETKAFIDAVYNMTEPKVTGEDGFNSLKTALDITHIIETHPSYKNFHLSME